MILKVLPSPLLSEWVVVVVRIPSKGFSTVIVFYSSIEHEENLERLSGLSFNTT